MIYPFRLLFSIAAILLGFSVGPVWADIGEIGEAGAKPVPIKQLVAEKRVRDQVDKALRERAIARKARQDKAAEAEKAAVAQDEQERAEGANSQDLTKDSAVSGVAAKAAEKVPVAPTPALVILFNRNHVDFDRDLRHLLETSERSKKTVHYDILSEVPATVEGGRRNERVQSEYASNLNAVVDKFAQMGVQVSRVNVQTKPSEKITAQTVSIFQD